MFSPIAYPLEVLVQEAHFETGIEEDQIRILLCMVLQFALGWVLWAVVRGTLIRHLYSIFFGLFLQSYMYGYEIIYVFLISFLSYLAMSFLPRQKQNWIVIPLCMGIILWNHIQTMLYFDG